MSGNLAAAQQPGLKFSRPALLICPTGRYCREDRCQSFFKFSLIPTMRAPLEECQLAGGFSKVGAEPVIVDGPAEEISDQEFIERVVGLAPDLIIFSVTFGSLKADLLWAARLRELSPTAKIGIRGAPVYVYGEKLLRENQCIDFGIRGDYELVAEELALSGVEGARGLIYRTNNGVSSTKEIPYSDRLDQLPFPDRSTLKGELYSVRGFGKPQATIHVQRGCPYPCTYCLVHTVSGDKARHRSPDHIVTEMKQLVEEGVNHFYLRAETFSLDKEWVLELCSQIKREVPTARWVTTTRVDRVDDEIVSAMSRAGCYGVSFGIDTGSQLIANKVKKKLDLGRSREAIALCNRYGVISLAYIMIGFIWDTAETVQEAEDYILGIKADLVTVHFAHPYPGTTYYDQFQASKNKVVSLRAQSEPALDSESLSTKELLSASNRILRKHYFRFSTVYSIFRKVIGIAWRNNLKYSRPHV